MNLKKLIRSLFYLFFPLVLGGLVGFLISSSIDYKFLILPPFSPPSYIFPIAWSIIYLLMGISYFLFSKKADYRLIEKFIYYFQLFVNLMWPILFFVWKWRFFSILWILLLDVLVLKMIQLFYKDNKIASYLNVPYFLWILFATYLTIGIYILN